MASVAEPAPRYGVSEQSGGGDDVDQAVELIRLRGYAVVGGGYGEEDLAELSAAFDRVRIASAERHGGIEKLAEIGEECIIRAPLAYDIRFLQLAANPIILEVCRRLIGQRPAINQQNGLINPALGRRYAVDAFHRDLLYQHFVSSRPLAVNALFCLDEFTTDNGSTVVIPASHKQEAFPSDAIVTATGVQVVAPAGSFLVLDGMLYHRGGRNETARARRAVNHVYTSPIIRPQLELPSLLGEDFTSDPELRYLLGYGFTPPASVDAFYAKLRARASNGA